MVTRSVKLFALGVPFLLLLSGCASTQTRASVLPVCASASAEGNEVPSAFQPQLRSREQAARAIVQNYPSTLRQAGIGGTILVNALIDAEGQVVRAEIHESSGLDPLDQAALAAIQDIHFSPASNGECRLSAWIRMPISFRTQ